MAFLIPLIRAFLQHFTYVGLFLVLVGSGMGIPIPEDVPLIFSGYMCHPEHSPMTAVMIDSDGDGVPDTRVAPPPQHPIPHLPIMIIAGMIGVLAGDSIVYTIGRRGFDSNNVVARHLRKVMHSKRRERLEAHFQRHGNLTVIVARFLPAARSIVFAMAGVSRMSYLRFLILDGMAAAVSVPLFIWLGYHFAAEIDTVFVTIHHLKEILLPIALGVGIVCLVIYLIRKRARIEPAA
jgi:membrane protein DedA with SNARE-associated domain